MAAWFGAREAIGRSRRAPGPKGTCHRLKSGGGFADRAGVGAPWDGVENGEGEGCRA
jgi:hypothetical protein